MAAQAYVAQQLAVAWRPDWSHLRHLSHRLRLLHFLKKPVDLVTWGGWVLRRTFGATSTRLVKANQPLPR